MLAALFPGQGSQYVGMGRDLYQGSSRTRLIFKEAEDILSCHLTRIMFEGPEDLLRQTIYAQPALLTLSIALICLLEEEGRFPLRAFSFFAGHSLGEYTALCAAKVLTFADALRLIKVRSREMSKISEGGMVAVLGLPVEEVNAVLQQFSFQESVCEIANDNTPEQLVLSGTTQDLNAVIRKMEEKGARCIPLKVSGPFHSSLMQPAQEKLAEALYQVPFSAPIVPVVTNISASPQKDPRLLKEDLIRQLTGRVLWRATQVKLHKLGVDTFIEIGAGKVLCGLAKKTVPGVSCISLQTSDDVRQFEWSAAPKTAGSLAI